MTTDAHQAPKSPSSRSQKYSQKRQLLREELWPGLNPDLLWHRKKAMGFSTIPRPMPLMLVIMDSLSVGRPVSTTFLDLWCRSYDEGFCRLDRPHEMAFAAGFITSRGPHIWAERLDILAKLGFIKLAPGAQGPRSFALIYNPYHVIKALKLEGKVSLALYNALFSAADAVGATDLDAQVEVKETPLPRRKRRLELSAVA